ncbi:unnamed protein product [Spirodela intermedia]|uniref:Uncharacterized protein n=1 Tax=Spirodela intermedia TaxID=51605 RepID=A0A7I8KVY3_SPIIN|nr:unnamed protein product [Spirodela intermedia]
MVAAAMMQRFPAALPKRPASMMAGEVTVERLSGTIVSKVFDLGAAKLSRRVATSAVSDRQGWRRRTTTEMARRPSLPAPLGTTAGAGPGASPEPEKERRAAAAVVDPVPAATKKALPLS